MKINLTVEVESRAALADILASGKENTLHNCQVLDFKII